MTIAEIYLEARNPARDCMRAYRLTLTRDLFGVFIVETRYGRIGTYGHALTYSFESEDDAHSFMEKCVRRRNSAPRRIGTTYVLQHVANHESAGTTGLYDRRHDQVNLDEVERIVI